MRKLNIVIGAVAVLGVFALSNAEEAQDKALAYEMAQSDLHEIMTDRISEAVMKMELLLHDQSRSEKELELARKVEAKAIADSAKELQHSVNMILALQPRLPLNKNEAPRFVELATTLKAQAQDLEALAINGQYASLKPAEETMKTTCNTCHKLFRGY